MKRILMLVVAVSLVCSCKSTKETKATTSANEKAIEKKLQQTWILENLNGKVITEKDFQVFQKL